MNEFVYPEIKSGLYLVSLPVGCLSDISFRALHMLSNSDYVAGEDTRSVRSLFKLLKISKSIKSIISYHDHSPSSKRGKIIDLIRQGKSVALVSDAGTPLISDPGYKLVKTTIEEGFEVFSVPGPSSVIAALTNRKEESLEKLKPSSLKMIGWCLVAFQNNRQASPA